MYKNPKQKSAPPFDFCFFQFLREHIKRETRNASSSRAENDDDDNDDDISRRVLREDDDKRKDENEF